jgi:hypothetical protein
LLIIFICCFPSQMLVISRTKVYGLNDLQIHFPGGENQLFMSVCSHLFHLNILRAFRGLFPNFNCFGSVFTKLVLINICQMNDKQNTYKMRPLG